MRCSPGSDPSPTMRPTSRAAQAFGLLPKRRYDLARAVDAEQRPWPQDRQIEPGLAIFREPVAAAADRPEETDRVEHAVAQRRVAGARFGLVGLLDKAADPQQPLEEWQ